MIIKNIPAKYSRILLATLVCLVPMAVHAQNKNQTPVETPKIVFETLEHDFGTTKPNKPLTHSFIFKNQGTAELVIEKVKAG